MTEQSSEPTAEGLTEADVIALAKVLSGATPEFSDRAAESHMSQARRLLASDWLADRLAAVQAERERRVTENDSEFLMRTLTPHQWEVIGRKVRAEVEAAEAERDAALDRVKAVLAKPDLSSMEMRTQIRAAVGGGRS